MNGLAFGAYGEASPDVHALLTVAADGLAARQWRDMGAHAAALYRARSAQWGF
jgi:hypothetical protein